MSYSITREDGTADALALQAALNVLKASKDWDTPLAARLRELRDSIEEQVKPVVEEPTAWGSIVRASAAGDSRILWTYVPNDKDSPEYCWYSEADQWQCWGNLSAVEVLRVGIGVELARNNGYEQATKNTRERLYNRITALKPQLITSVEKTVIDKALAEIEADVEDTVTGSGIPS